MTENPLDSVALLSVLSQFCVTKGPYRLEPMKKLLQRLGSPQKKMPPAVHIGGTNGKGSVTSFLDSCLTASGFSVHRYTSPHLISYTQRIHVSGHPINEKVLIDYLKVCQRYSDEQISLFEALTASAFLAFSESLADAALIEVGLGGDCDATNLLETTCASVITPISYDHQDVLGSTLTQIAFHKSGIMRPGIPCIIGPQRPHIMKALEQYAPATTPLFRFGREWMARRWKDPGFYFWWGKHRRHCPPIGLVGDHQAVNAGTAMAVLSVQKIWSLSDASIQRGLAHVSWPGRLQPVTAKALGLSFPEDWDLWVDGAHNEGGARVLHRHITRYWQDRPLILVIGLLQTKDCQTFYNILAPLAKVCFIFSDFHQTARPFQDFVDCARNIDRPLLPLVSLEDLSCFQESSPRVLFCGSLYFVGYLLTQGIRLAG